MLSRRREYLSSSSMTPPNSQKTQPDHSAEKDIPYRKIQLAQLSPQEWGDLSDVAQQMDAAAYVALALENEILFFEEDKR